MAGARDRRCDAALARAPLVFIQHSGRPHGNARAVMYTFTLNTSPHALLRMIPWRMVYGRKRYGASLEEQGSAAPS